MGGGKADGDRKFKELTGAVNASFRDSRACGRGAVPPREELLHMASTLCPARTETPVLEFPSPLREGARGGGNAECGPRELHAARSQEALGKCPPNWSLSNAVGFTPPPTPPLRGGEPLRQCSRRVPQHHSRPAGPVLAPFCLVLLSAVIDPEKAVEAFAWRLLARRLAKPF